MKIKDGKKKMARSISRGGTGEALDPVCPMISGLASSPAI